MPIRQELLDILVCPKCKGALELTPEPEGFGCDTCNLFFKIEDNIPNFLLDEAVSWKSEPVSER